MQKGSADMGRHEKEGQRHDYSEYFPLSSSKELNLVTRELSEAAQDFAYVHCIPRSDLLTLRREGTFHQTGRARAATEVSACEVYPSA